MSSPAVEHSSLSSSREDTTWCTNLAVRHTHRMNLHSLRFRCCTITQGMQRAHFTLTTMTIKDPFYASCQIKVSAVKGGEWRSSVCRLASVTSPIKDHEADVLTNWSLGLQLDPNRVLDC